MGARRAHGGKSGVHSNETQADPAKCFLVKSNTLKRSWRASLVHNLHTMGLGTHHWCTTTISVPFELTIANILEMEYFRNLDLVHHLHNMGAVETIGAESAPLADHYRTSLFE